MSTGFQLYIRRIVFSSTEKKGAKKTRWIEMQIETIWYIDGLAMAKSLSLCVEIDVDDNIVVVAVVVTVVAVQRARFIYSKQHNEF